MNGRWKIIGLVAAAGLIVLAITHSSNQPHVISAPTPPPVAQTPISIEPAREIPQPQLQPTPQTKTVAQAHVQNPPPNQNASVTPGKEPLRDPAAREALALVGVDPNAEQYWLEAIFDPSLPDNEREDLMEDLNETGFDDPKNLTADDLPLIFSRLEIIDSVLPNADDFMAEHLLEAQKDLVNMFGKVTAHR